MFEDSDIVSKPGALAEEQEAEGGESAFVVDLQFARLYLAHSPRVGAVGQQTFVRTKVQRRADFQLQSGRTFQQPVDDVGRVLEMRHHHALLDADTVLRKSPHRKAALERELLEESRFRIGNLFSAAVLVAAEPVADSVGFNDLFEMIEHHRARERSGQCGNQMSVEAARTGAADRSRSVAAEGVGDEPFASEKRVKRIAARPAELQRLRCRLRNFIHPVALFPC